MNVGLFGRDFAKKHHLNVQNLFKTLSSKGIVPVIYKDFYHQLESKGFELSSYTTFETGQQLVEQGIDVLVSMGGDGTILNASSLVIGHPISILGINTGRLGFLSSVSVNEVDVAMQLLVDKEYIIDFRTTLKLETKKNVFGKENFALNELTISRRDTSSMIKVEVYMNDEYLNTYWSDGLIVSTSTGSTAYSLSCGGPVVYPGSGNFILTPIAPHNLNVRPMIIPNDITLKLKVEGRNESFLVSLDSRTSIVADGLEFTVKKHEHSIQLVRLPNHSYLTTLRSKLNWGLDKRN